jgi:DNA (cytosine-5)-methyltransferase 1
MNVLSLFAGIGGLELGLERAGMTVVGQVELDEYCRSVLAYHWPEVPRHDDVRTAPEWWLDITRPVVDLICGGPPCQPFSRAGLRRGVGDARWGWPWMADVVRAIRPRYVVMENVSTLLDDPDAFGCILGDLDELGFDAEWEVLRASDLGAPHKRERLFVVAYAKGNHGADQDEPTAARTHELEPRGGRWKPRRTGWLPEPEVDRVAHGVPRRLVHDPLHALGNAVVPQVAQFIGEMVMDHAGVNCG